MGRLKSLMGLLMVALVTSSCFGQVNWECPPSCKCIWVSGKKTTECKRLNLTDIPVTLSKETQHLDLSGNLIRHLPQTVFFSIGLVNLQKLVLRECGIRSIDAQAFSGLRIVIEIDLSGNRIRQLYSGTFGETERLRVILLNDNRLQKLDDGLFHDLQFLQKVQLSDNHLVQIGPHSFLNLPGLQTLALDGNNFTRLDTRSFESLPSLGSLELQRNPWQCDCHLKPFRDWAIRRKLYTQPTSCAAPAALMGRHWDEVPAEEFACLPRIESLGAGLRAGVAVLWCRAQASPRAQISWVHRPRLLANGTKRPYLLELVGDWANLTVPEPQPADRGEYVCVARNFAGAVEGNVNLPVLADLAEARDAGLGLPLALGLGLLAFLFLLVALTLCLCYCRRRRSLRDEKGAEAASLDQHGLGAQEKSLITAIN